MIAGTVLVGLIIERVGYRPVRGAPEVTALLTSFAVGPDPAEQHADPDPPGRSGARRCRCRPSPLLSGVVNIGPITVPRLNIVALVAGDRAAGPAHVLRHPHQPGPLDARRGGRSGRRQPGGHQYQPGHRDRLCDQLGDGRGRRAAVRRRRPARSTPTWASRRC